MPRNKYHAQPTTIDGIRFDSKREAARYLELKLLHLAGVIHKLQVHPRYVLLEPFECKGVKYRGIFYEGDFEYYENGQRVCEDVKGVKTQVFRIKEKLFIKRYGDEIELRVVK